VAFCWSDRHRPPKADGADPQKRMEPRCRDRRGSKQSHSTRVVRSRSHVILCKGRAKSARAGWRGIRPVRRPFYAHSVWGSGSARTGSCLMSARRAQPDYFAGRWGRTRANNEQRSGNRGKRAVGRLLPVYSLFATRHSSPAPPGLKTASGCGWRPQASPRRDSRARRRQGRRARAASPSRWRRAGGR
jgi:hypothetical protein